MQKLILILSALLVSTSTYAGVTGSVGVDFSENAAGDVIATKDIDLDISSDVGFASIAVITNASDELVLDEYALGVKGPRGSISYGDQGDIFIGGGLEVVGADTLANPSDAGESILINAKNTSVRFKFTDTGTDVTDFDTIQVKHSLTLGSVAVAGSVDHTIETDDNIFAVEGVASLGSEAKLTAVATHNENLADPTAAEAIISTGGYSLFVNGDESDWTQNAGAGYKSTYKSVDWYIEAGYNMDSEDVTPAAGVSVNF